MKTDYWLVNVNTVNIVDDFIVEKKKKREVKNESSSKKYLIRDLI